MITQLRQRLLGLQRSPIGPGTRPLGIPAIDAILGGGLIYGALHEVAASGEAHFPTAMGFVLGLVAPPQISGTTYRQQQQTLRNDGVCMQKGKSIVWLAEDMVLVESGAPHGAGLDAFGIQPEYLVTVLAMHRRDLLWAMEEALRCRAVRAVIGELRAGAIDAVAVRRLSLAAVESGSLGLLLRTTPPNDASAAATRWIVGTASKTSVIAGRERTRNDTKIKTRFTAQLVRNRRGPVGSWILEWSESDGQFMLATHAQPVAVQAFDRPHRQVA
ncbi:MAG TPA: hypothetical protein VFP60_00610 [Pseudolabrys sp.]|nr:hypothetical protein [Pseudolabrys sp.]